MKNTKNPKPRIFWRSQKGGTRRAYADFRDYADVGGKQEALVQAGMNRATDDPAIAEQLAADRLLELKAKRQAHAERRTTNVSDLGNYVVHHLKMKRQSGWSVQLVSDHQRNLDEAIDFFQKTQRVGPRDLLTIGVADVQQWAAHLAQQPTNRRLVNDDGTVGRRLRDPATVRKYLNALSNLYARAASEGFVPSGYNPVASMMEKPIGDPEEADWLGVDDAALLLEVARTMKFPRADVATRMAYPLLATFLLTGGRSAEVRGLKWTDISFDRKTVTFRKNEFRPNLKTKTSRRVVPLWPQLEEVLRAYEDIGNRSHGALVFPNFVHGKEKPIGDFRKTLDAIAERAGWVKGEVRSRMFRHSYCSARLQTLDRGHPVSIYTVQCELGHGSEQMVKDVYAHLGEIRHRAEVVEFRVEQHARAQGRLDVIQRR